MKMTVRHQSILVLFRFVRVFIFHLRTGIIKIISNDIRSQTCSEEPPSAMHMHKHHDSGSLTRRHQAQVMRWSVRNCTGRRKARAKGSSSAPENPPKFVRR